VVALVLLGAVAGWRRSWRGTVAFLAVGPAVAELVNLGAIMTTAHSAPQKLGQVSSLEALVGRVPPVPVPVPAAAGYARSGGTVVLGDLTAAGLGNPALPHPDAADRACHRSVDSHAVAVATGQQLAGSA
jgi:hypothetical protein